LKKKKYTPIKNDKNILPVEITELPLCPIFLPKLNINRKFNSGIAVPKIISEP
jgi:hypothetical protein